MVDLNEDFVMSLDEFRKVLNLSVSGERRLRNEEPDWPPHLMVGRKVFYSREGVRNFLDRQMARSVGVSADPADSTEGVRRIGECDCWPAGFTSDQLSLLEKFVAGIRAAGADRRADPVGCDRDDLAVGQRDGVS